nr:D-alanyl-D-alanine carboxypeptidase family protein [uncultured Ruminococcus sp.]
MKRVVCLMVALIVICATVISASAVDYGCNVATKSKAVYLENLDTGAVILEKSAEERVYPASTTKIMTYAVVADNVADFDHTMVDINEAVFKDLDPESTVMGLSQHIGEKYSIRDLLYGMMLPSGNDAALVLADFVGGGSIPAFVEKMNAKAQELGCSGTSFVNPHGLHDPNHYTTAKDMATIAKYAITTQDFMTITSTVSYTPERFDQPITNTNYMMINNADTAKYYYPNVKGIKTGYTDEAGKCLVTTASKDGLTYLAVCMGAEYSFEEDINYAMLDSCDLYDWVFENMAQRTVYGATEVVKTVNVNFGKGEDKVSLMPQGELTALLPKNYDQSLVKVEVECDDAVDAPVTKGQAVGKVTVKYDDMTVGTTDAIASKDIELDRTKVFWKNVGDWFKKNFILIAIIAVVIIALIIVLVAAANSRKKKRERERARRRYRNY